jgi:bloom syndrome protein
LKLQVRASPRKPRAKETAAKKSKKARTEYPSTNVSSPIRAPKQTIRQYAYKEDDDEDDETFDAPRHPVRKKKARGYEDDGFVVDDDDFDKEFAPVRVAKPTKTAKVKRPGPPIPSADERVDAMDDKQQCTFIDFMTGARKLRREITAEKGHREPIFNDTVLQNMGLELPTDLDEMSCLPGIKQEMLERYGKRFMPLIRNSKRLYRGNVPERRYLQPLPQTVNDVDEQEDDDEVLDPNHQNIIDLCSDGEAIPVEEDSESNYFDSDDEEDDGGELHISHYFTQHVDPEVEAFNNQMTQLGPAVPKSAKASRATAPRGGSNAPTARKGKAYRRSGSGSVGKSFAGVKKGAPKGTNSRASGGAGTAKKATTSGRRGQPSGGTLPGNWGSIMAMPT